jgi:pimeloyl-ACP methyl ester carboxylesterase
MDQPTGTIETNGLQFAYRAEGPEDGPLALCLHGFPDTAGTWRYLLPALAGAGYRAVAPWMRGYAPTAVPADGRYQTGALAADANALHEALGGDDNAIVIGHDWGASAAYGAAGSAPDRWSRVVAMAVPPGPALMSGFLSYDQIRRSFYMYFFQTPLADFVVPMNDLEFIARLWEDWSPGYDATTDVAAVRESLGASENLQAALGYYRATISGVGVDPALDKEQAAGGQIPAQQLLYLHGDADGCVGVSMAEAARPLLQAPSRVEVVAGAGHFLHLEKPDEVNRLVLDFLAE